MDELANGSFQEVIDDASANPKKVKTLVFCTGKFYYDLLAEKENQQREDVALVRLEQLFPLPAEQMLEILEKYAHADDIVWAQEEPKNMGAWSHLMMHFEEVNRFTRVAARRIYASPAAGSAVRSKMRHQQVIDYVFDKNKDNSTKKKSRKEAQQNI